MEQRIGPTIPPVHAAGTDPAYVPGITPPGPAGAADAAPEQETPEQEAPELEAPEQELPEQAPESTPEDAAAEDAASDDAVIAEKAEEGKAEEGAEETSSEEAEGEEGDDADGPVFEISDHRGSVTADRAGIRFRLDSEKAEFGWGEIGAVEFDTSRFGRRFAVTVYTTDRRVYNTDVEASARGLLKEWTAELDAVLDAYFES
ncbi:hypothetical protein [Streptomyces sp. XD-27]|uniref:hypothetical protein n=1 Tax=Streptomyces sp. XD-27 TaxID=3062779 RepID=UPI0026F441FB|nr:hypothetical protein [Streptomyces sp. XD-27]WKX71349.1 hypothetical protein Q3Y56_16850 [Streptomyces sp. XD-27]